MSFNRNLVVISYMPHSLQANMDVPSLLILEALRTGLLLGRTNPLIDFIRRWMRECKLRGMWNNTIPLKPNLESKF